jgi:hypothetical protein
MRAVATVGRDLLFDFGLCVLGARSSGDCRDQRHFPEFPRYHVIRNLGYRPAARLDTYAGTLYTAVHDGLASGYLHSTDLNPTIGLRYTF